MGWAGSRACGFSLSYLLGSETEACPSFSEDLEEIVNGDVEISVT